MKIINIANMYENFNMFDVLNIKKINEQNPQLHDMLYENLKSVKIVIPPQTLNLL